MAGDHNRASINRADLDTALRRLQGGLTEIALTEHLFRFRQADALLREGDAYALAGRLEAQAGTNAEGYALEMGLDAETRQLIAEILEVEERHRENLGGKWTLA